MTNPEGFPRPPLALPDLEPPAAPYPDYTSPNDAFALELRAESIEQLSGGDALRRGESERIEAGGSHSNADVVVGRDRAQVQGTLAEHTGHGFAVQAAHLDTTVGGPSDTWAGKENTVLLAGHMCDTWNGGTATLAAMSDDTAAGGGVRATAVLDLWAHGLMGLEERPGTCTADGALFEACGTLYEREYRSAVHAAGLAVFNGTLYQSVRTSFRPLMRISMGVRNLIAGSGGGVGGEAPPDSAPPAGAAGGEQGADAAAGTLAAGRGTADTPQSGPDAIRLDEAAALTRESDITAVSDDVSHLHRCADTAERLGELRDGLHGGEVASAARADAAGAIVCVRPAVGAHGALEIEPSAAVAAEKAPAVHAGDPLRAGTRGKLGLIGGAGDPSRARPEILDWGNVYRTLNVQYQRHREDANGAAVDAYREAIEAIDASVMQNYSFFGGRREDLAHRSADVTETEAAYDALRRMASEAERSRGSGGRRASMLNALGTIHQLTDSTRNQLAARRLEFVILRPLPGLPRPPDPGIDKPFLEQWLRSQTRRARLMSDYSDPDGRLAALNELAYFGRLHNELAAGHDPVAISNRLIEELRNSGHASQAWRTERLHLRLAQAMVDPAMRVPAIRPGRGTHAPTGARPAAAVAGPGVPGPFGRPVQLPDVPGLSRSIAVQTESLLGEPPSGMRAGATVGGASHVHEMPSVVTPQRVTESTSWTRPTEPAKAAATAEFDSGLRRAGETQGGVPQVRSDTSATGSGEATGRPHTGTPAPAHRPGSLHTPRAWVEDDFAVERALNEGRLPADFNASGLIRDWHWLAKDTTIEGHLESGLLPTPTIEAIIEGYRAMDPAGGYNLIIGQLETMKAAIARALTDAYRFRAHPDWLARVDETLQIRRAAEATASVSGSRLAGEIVEPLPAATQSLPPPPSHPSAADLPGIETGAGALSPTGDPWRGRAPGTPSGQDPVRFGDGRTAGAAAASVPATPATSRAGVPQGWHAGESPGFGRPTSTPDAFPFSRREQIVHRLVTGEALSQAQTSELTRRFGEAIAAGEIGSSAPQWRTAFLRDLRRLAVAARTSPATAAALEDVDWSAIAALLQLLDAPARSR